MKLEDVVFGRYAAKELTSMLLCVVTGTNSGQKHCTYVEPGPVGGRRR